AAGMGEEEGLVYWTVVPLPDNDLLEPTDDDDGDIALSTTADVTSVSSPAAARAAVASATATTTTTTSSSTITITITSTSTSTSTSVKSGDQDGYRHLPGDATPLPDLQPWIALSPLSVPREASSIRRYHERQRREAQRLEQPPPQTLPE